jgi:archaellum component FlaD/FlaE
MVMGLIDFLLGGKKKSKMPKTARVQSSLNQVGVNVNQNEQNIPDGTNQNPTANTQDNGGANGQNESPVMQQQSFPQQRKPIGEVINAIHKELKSTNDRLAEIVTDVKKMENSVLEITNRVEDLEVGKKEMESKFSNVDENMNKFLSLYELVNNQYNPFVEKMGSAPQIVPEQESVEPEKQEILINNDGSTENEEPKETFEELATPPVEKEPVKTIEIKSTGSQLLELDTLNIEEAAGNAVPLTSLKNNTNSLVTILTWLEYMIKKVGIDETRNNLRYYTETLRWISPEVFFELDKYLRGMKDKKNLSGDEKLEVRDHIVSLYFISKLNERNLDEKLTRAVLQIIKD